MSFNRIKALGWALYETLTSAQMTQLDIDHAKATDSTYVKDYGAACFVPTRIVNATWANKDALVYIPGQSNWLGVGQTQSSRSAGGYSVRTATTFPSGWLQSAQPNAIAHDGNQVVLAGSVENGTTKTTWRRTTDYDIWTKQSQNVAATSAITCVGWWAAKSLFIAGFSEPTGAIETSPDGITWTSRSPADTVGRNAIAFNGNIAVIVSGRPGTSTTGFCQTSLDGITWTNRTMPSTKSWVGVEYSVIDGVFLAIASDGTVAKSPDGITWSAVVTSYSTTVSSAGAPLGTIMMLRCINNLWLAGISSGGSFTGGVLCSFDIGTTWRSLVETTNGFISMGAYGGQLAVADGQAIYFSNKLSLN